MTASALADLMACLGAPDPDQALAELARSGDILARLPATSSDAPLAGIAVVMMVNALARRGRGSEIAPFAAAVAERFGGRHRPHVPGTLFDDLASDSPIVFVAVIVASMAAGDGLQAARAIRTFEEVTRALPNGGQPDAADVAELLRHPEAAARGPFRFDRAWILDRQEEIRHAGRLDRQLEVVRDFEELFVVNALMIRDPERALPVVDAVGETYVQVGNSRGGHLEFNAVCVLATLGRFEDALRLARASVRHGDPFLWRYDLSKATSFEWARAMGQSEWLGPMAETPAYRDFLRDEILYEPLPADDPDADALIAVRDGVWNGKTPKRCWLSRRMIAPGEPVVRVRRLTHRDDGGVFAMAAADAFAASRWAEARRLFDADRVPLAALFPAPRRLPRPPWTTAGIAALHHDLARGARLDLDRAAALVADHAPNPIRHAWLRGLHAYADGPEPMVDDEGHGDAVNLLWRLLKAGHAEALFARFRQMPEADRVFAMLATFDRDDCRAAAAAHFALPELPALMELAFSERPSLGDHLALAAFGRAQPRWRAGLVSAMRAYALHLYSNYRPGVDWFLQGLEHYSHGRCCQLLFFLVHHPEDDPVLAAMLEREWLPTGVATGGFDAYGNGRAFYVRAAMFHLMLHAPDRIGFWLDSEWMAFYCNGAKDRDTRRMVERWRKTKRRTRDVKP